MENSRRSKHNRRGHEASIDTIEVGKMHAAINLGRYQEETQRWKNKKAKPRDIKEGDLVLRRIPKAKQKGKMHSK